MCEMTLHEKETHFRTGLSNRVTQKEGRSSLAIASALKT